MGVTASCNLVSLASNQILRKLSSENVIPLIDPFWISLLDFSLLPTENSSDARLLEESVASICGAFVKNNLQSGNMSSLLSILMSLIKHTLSETPAPDNPENKELLETLYNTLLIVRTLAKFIIQSETPEVSIRHFVTPDVVAMTNPQSESPPTIALKHINRYETSVDELCYYLYEFLINYPVRSGTVHIHSECVKILTTLFSSQLYHSGHTSPYFTDLMCGRCAHSAPQLINTLLHNIIREPAPPPLALWDYMWSYVPYVTVSPKCDHDKQLSTECLMFTLLLVNHCTQRENPYRQALFTFGHEEPSSNLNDTCFNINLNKLYTYFCKDEIGEQDTLLLYTLLHGNENVKSFILSRTDIERLLLPMMRVLYDAELHSTHHMYMILIILLILTHDDSFGSYVHDLIVPVLPWYKERNLVNISVGGILILVILKTIQSNITKIRDRYLHTNCLATLANMSSKFHSFHPYVAEKVLNLFGIIIKKYSKIRNTLLGVGGETIPIEHSTEYMQSELDTLEDVIRMFLEIFNSSICYSGKCNPVFLYELLHKRELFVPFQTHPTFSVLVVNIESILGYLSVRLEERYVETTAVSVSGVMDVIEEVIRQWPADRLRKSPILKFEYVEESRPEEFFLPYIWTLLFSNSTMYWDTSLISLSQGIETQ